MDEQIQYDIKVNSEPSKSCANG